MVRKSKENIKNETIDYMRSLGNYKPEYYHLIDIYSDLIWERNLLMGRWKKKKYVVSEEYTNKAGATNQRKVPILSRLEVLDKDILTYSDRLMLNPKADNVQLVATSNSGNAFGKFMEENLGKLNE